MTCCEKTDLEIILKSKEEFEQNRCLTWEGKSVIEGIWEDNTTKYFNTTGIQLHKLEAMKCWHLLVKAALFYFLWFSVCRIPACSYTRYSGQMELMLFDDGHLFELHMFLVSFACFRASNNNSFYYTLLSFWIHEQTEFSANPHPDM